MERFGCSGWSGFSAEDERLMMDFKLTRLGVLVQFQMKSALEGNRNGLPKL